jgi:hypothetical protein
MYKLHFFQLNYKFIKLNLFFLFILLIIIILILIKYYDFLKLNNELNKLNDHNKTNKTNVKIVDSEKITNQFTTIDNLNDYFIFIEKTSLLGCTFENINFNIESSNSKNIKINAKIITNSPELITKILDFKVNLNNVNYKWKLNNFNYNSTTMLYSIDISSFND